MKQFCFLLLFAMTAGLFASATPAAMPAKPAEPTKSAATADKTALSVLNTIYTTNRKASEFADQEKAEALLKRRAELVQKIQEERKRILKEDPKAKALNEDIMCLVRQLIELNFQLNELDDAISRLKPAPQPGSEPQETKTNDAGKAEKE